jgi:hypothetical protein
MSISEPPTYEEAVSEDHLPGHEPIWELCNSGRMCKLCGYIERQVNDCDPNCSCQGRAGSQRKERHEQSG